MLRVLLQSRWRGSYPWGAVPLLIINSSSSRPFGTHVGFGQPVTYVDSMKPHRPNTPASEEVKSAKPYFDPISVEYDVKMRLKRSRFKVDQASMDEYCSEEEVRKWITVKEAAAILRIKPDKLYALKPAEVEVAWAAIYRSLSPAQRKEAMIATETLLDYINSDVHSARTKDHYRRIINNAACDVEDSLQGDKTKIIEKFYNVFGVWIIIIYATLAGGAFVLWKFMTKAEINEILDGTRAQGKYVLNLNSSAEPPPDYKTRYRDTPTALDLHLEGPHPEVTDRSLRLAMNFVDEVDQNEQKYIAALVRDAAENGGSDRHPDGAPPVSPTTAAARSDPTSFDALLQGAKAQMPSPLRRLSSVALPESPADAAPKTINPYDENQIL